MHTLDETALSKLGTCDKQRESESMLFKPMWGFPNRTDLGRQGEAKIDDARMGVGVYFSGNEAIGTCAACIQGQYWAFE